MAEITLEVAKKKLNLKQLTFCAEYLLDLNATQAASRAKYSKKTARQQGARLLSNVYIQRIIQEGADKRFKKLDISKDRVLQELARLGFSRIDDHVKIDDDGYVRAKTFDEMPDDAIACVKLVKEKKIIKGSAEGDGQDVILESTFEFALHDKIKPLELLGKHMKLFTDKVEITGDSAIESLVEAVHELEQQCKNRGAEAS